LFTGSSSVSGRCRLQRLGNLRIPERLIVPDSRAAYRRHTLSFGLSSVPGLYTPAS